MTPVDIGWTLSPVVVIIDLMVDVDGKVTITIGQTHSLCSTSSIYSCSCRCDPVLSLQFFPADVKLGLSDELEVDIDPGEMPNLLEDDDTAFEIWLLSKYVHCCHNHYTRAAVLNRPYYGGSDFHFGKKVACVSLHA